MNKLVFLYFILYSLCSIKAWSCRCDTEIIKLLMENPSSAKTAFIGHLEISKNKKILRNLLAWSEYQSTYDLMESPGTCAMKLSANEDLLFLSNLDGDEITKTGRGFNICNTLAIELPKAKNYIEKLAKYNMRPNLRPNPSWYYCEKNEDCIFARDVCGEAGAINIKFKTDQENFVKARAPAVNCETGGGMPVLKPVTCKKYFCRVEQ